MTAAVLCEQCPWRRSNHGKRSPGGFYSQKNLRRLWSEIRSGGGFQTCHLTDPSHPDHVAAGAPQEAKPRECLGSLVLVAREIEVLEKTVGAGGTYQDYTRGRHAPLTLNAIAWLAMGRPFEVALEQQAANAAGREASKMEATPSVSRAFMDDYELIGRPG